MLPDDSSAPQRSHLSAPFSPFVHAPRLGVLLVHGIGDQKRGETVDWAGEPLFNWIKHWVEGSLVDAPPDQARVYLADTYLTRQDPLQATAPPFARLGFARQPGRRSAEDENWLLAESWWAADFAPPSFGDLVPWGLSYGPWLLLRILRLTAGRLWAEIRFDRRLLRIFQAVVLLPLSVVLFILVGILFHIFVIALLVLAIIPGLRGLVLSLQLGLAGWLGDAYLIATSPIRLNAMVTQIQDDLAWLFTEAGCEQVAVIAHSGGAPIAYQAVLEVMRPQDAPANRVILITYGSGQSKLEVMRNVLQRRVGKRVHKLPPLGPALRTAGLGLVLFGAAPLLEAFRPFTTAAGVSIPIGIVLLVLGVLILTYLAVSELLFDRQLSTLLLRQPLPASWFDIYAVGDPVAEGDIGVDTEAPPAPPGTQIAPHSIRVDNLDSIVQDHTTYWNNAEQFLPWLLRIFGTHGVLDSGSVLQISTDERRVLTEFSRRRKRRVRTYLITGFFSLLLVPTIALALGPKLSLVTSLFLQIPVPFLSGILRILPLEDPVAAVVFSFAMVAAGVALTHQVLLFSAWRSWSRQETNAVFTRSHDPAVQADPAAALRDLGREATGFFAWWLCTPAILFVVFLVAVPGLSGSPWGLEPWVAVPVTLVGVYLIVNTLAVISNWRQNLR